MADLWSWALSPYYGLGKSITDNMTGAADEMPGYQPPPKNPEDQAFQDKHIQELQASPEELKTRNLAGVADAGKGLLADKNDLHTGGSGNEALHAALARRTNDIYGNAQGGARSKADISAPITQFNRLDHAQNTLMAQHQIDTHIYQKQYAAWLARQNARNSVLQTVFKAAGSILGGIVGGPGGAVAGAGVANAGGPPDQSSYADQVSQGQNSSYMPGYGPNSSRGY